MKAGKSQLQTHLVAEQDSVSRKQQKSLLQELILTLPLFLLSLLPFLHLPSFPSSSPSPPLPSLPLLLPSFSSPSSPLRISCHPTVSNELGLCWFWTNDCILCGFLWNSETRWKPVMKSKQKENALPFLIISCSSMAWQTDIWNDGFDGTYFSCRQFDGNHGILESTRDTL